MRAAQKWLNDTYTLVPGYVPIAVDGSPGPKTSVALIRALQHELNIEWPSDNFGWGTLAALTEHGPIGPGETNPKLIKIVESGAACRGYDPGGITGVFGTRLTDAVAALMTDAGLAGSIDGTVVPKVCRALLSVDGYLLASGGSPHVREAQRWLNGRYLNRSAFLVLPCDGRRSRDLLTTLTFAVQYEVGLTDAQANGSFGPLTQAGVRANGLIKAGSTGTWVRLFSAALTHYPAAQYFTADFDDALADGTRALQAFCRLTENGEGDFPTWASLLISTGDQARPGTAADTIDAVTPARAQTLLAAGYRTIGRYLTNVEGSSLDKKIKPGELATLTANGLSLFPIFQTAADSAGYFSWAQGYADARAAHDAALGHGIDAGAVIYFAVDYDATDADVTRSVIPHFLGVEAGLRQLGGRYAHGVYGARNVCSRLNASAFTKWSFVSGITSGWTGNVAYPLPANWAFDQISTVDVGAGGGGLEIDKCVLRPGTDAGESAFGSPASTLAGYLDWIDRLHDLALAYGSGDPAELVLEYLRAGRHDNWQSRQLGGGTDAGFLTQVDAAGLARVRAYHDPAAGVDVDVSRFGAAALAALRDPPRAVPGRGDFAGWGGDWIAFYGGWRFGEPATPARDYCAAHLARSDTPGALDLAGLVAGVDAHLAAEQVRGGAGLVDHLRAADRGTRFSGFYRGRFGTDPNAAATAAQSMLTATGDAALTAARDLLLRGLAVTPVAVDEQLRQLCRGFADRLAALAEAEQIRLNRREVP
ncbi:glycoside hydrolase domain-containing protein [Actinoplanes sp. NPDC026623]|uniref:glycoside hydrolase domain-containing protein n=1 Tax=Actinoplanes sp. NPDC026623 TaxID=3155610 RepID=UPI0033DFB851